MKEIDNYKNMNNSDDHIDLIELFFILVHGKWIILLVTVFFSITGIIYSLLLPNIYQSEALLAPVDVSSSLVNDALSQYSGLVGIVGNLPPRDADSNSQKAIEVMGSLSFFEGYIMPKIFLPDLMAVKFWDESKNTIVYDESIFKKNSNTWVNDFSDSKKSTPSAQESFEAFKGHFNIQIVQNGYVYFSIKHQSPFLAKQWIEIFIKEINDFYRQKDKAQSEKAVIYLNRQIAATSFTEIRQVTASLLEKEIQKLTLIEANSDYVFEYIYPPSIMEKKSEPYRTMIVSIFILIGIFLGSIFVLIRHYFLKEENSLETLNS